MAPTAVRTTSQASSRSNGTKTDEKHERVTQMQSSTPAQEVMAHGPEPANELLLRLMEQLVLTREFESKCEAMWKAGEHLVGEYHLSLGQEAIAVGTCAAIDPSDLICPSIRGMGVYLCRGTPLPDLMKTFFDREGAICGGRWAHWHSPVAEAGLLAQTGMLGSGLVTSAGAALTQQYLRTGKVVVAMLGDGATNTGYFHEGMNFAAFRQLPIVIIIENNGYAVSTPLASVVNVKHLSSRAAGYGMPGVTIDGNDVLLVYNTVRGAVGRARRGHGPTLIECMTYRFGGSTVKDPDQLRPLVEKEEARKNCPVLRFKSLLRQKAILGERGYDEIVTAMRARIDAAEREAKESALLDVNGDPLVKFTPYPDRADA